ncbi:MAG: hypothetical protein JW779_11570 [Candidatus Thorarchaeota archaeon]|nr:hypothetical protein [Candidatus Thorarchaeota archaeon]
MTQIKCPNCAGQIKVPPQSSTVVCPYCSTTVFAKTGTILKENYVMRLQYGLEDARDKMLSWAMKQLGAPKGLENAEVKESKIIFWPFWVVEVEAKVNYSGIQKKPDFKGHDTQKRLNWNTVSESGTIDVERDIFIPANQDTPAPLKNYIIPTRRKEYFNMDKIIEVQGITMSVQIDQKVAIDKAREIMEEYVQEEAMKEVDQINEIKRDLQTPAVFLVSVPIWHIKYSHNVRKYEGLVDGASGRVVYLKFPRKIAFRAMTLFGGLLHLGVGGGIGLLLVYLGLTAFDGIYPTAFGISFGLGMLAISLIFFRTALSLRAGMEETR